jgi:NAD(P)-dependent dehydrogenase (short-subunit alcohol dehydrogenase family)
MSQRFENQVVVVTGGNSGIGLATARAFRAEGAAVVVTGRDAKSLAAVGRELGEHGLALRSDAASAQEAEALVARVRERFGRIDVLFVNAGIAKFAPLEGSSEAFFDETFDVNVRGAYFLVQKALPLMPAGSSIVLNATALVELGMPGASVYSASKAALASLGKTLAAELADRGIRVNVVNPGPIATPIYDRMGLPQDAAQQMAESIKGQVPLKRFGQPEDIADAVLYLAGASFVTGNELFVDGGISRV